MKAVGLHVFIKPIHVEKTKGNILMPELETQKADVLHLGEVVSVGDGQYVGGKVKMGYKKGDRVLYRKGIDYKTEDGEKLKVLYVQDIVGHETVK